MIRPNLLLKIYIAEKVTTIPVVAVHRHPIPILEDHNAYIAQPFFSRLL
jgi:hypothetical protein